MSNPTRVFFDMNRVPQDGLKKPIGTTVKSGNGLVRWALISLLIVFFPFWFPLFWLWFLLGQPRLLVFLETAIIFIIYCFASSENGLLQSVMDVLVLTFVKLIIFLCLIYRTPEKAYPSWKRRLISLIWTFGISLILIFKFRTVSGTGQTIILTSLIGNIITCLSEHWIFTSLTHLAQAEDALLASAGLRLENNKSNTPPSLIRKFVAGISYFESVEMSHLNPKPALILTAGYGAGKAAWASVVPELQKTYHLYILDWNGTGLSSRPAFSARRLSQAEGFFIGALESWRAAVGLERFFLCGHSLGGYLASLYALQFPQHVQQLLLLSPVVGVPKDLEEAEKAPFNLFNKIFCFFWDRITPMYFLRFFGPLSGIITDKIIRFRFGSTIQGVEVGKLAAYLYHLSVGPPSGELALPLILAPGAHPRRPLSPLLGKLDVPTVFIYGEYDWVDSAGGKEAVQLLQKNQKDAKYLILSNAGHQLMFENPQGLSRLLLEATAKYR